MLRHNNESFEKNPIAYRFKMLCFMSRYVAKFNAVHAFRNVMTPKMLSFRETILKSPLGKIFYSHQKYKLMHLTLFAEASVFKNHTNIPI